MKLKTLALGAVTLSAGLTFPACTESNDKAEIVAVLPISGEFRLKGYTHKAAVQDAVVMLEEAGIADQIGKNIALTLVDSGDNKEAVTQRLDELLAEKDILGIISSAGAAHEGSVRPAMREKVVHFEVSSGSDDEEFLSGDERAQYDMSYAFMTRGLCHTEAILTVDFLMAEFPGKKVALVRGNQAHDIMHTDVIRAEIEARNAALDAAGTPELKVEVINTKESEDGDYALSYEVGNFQLELDQLMTDHAPDVIFWHLRGDDTNLRFMKDTQAAGFEGALVTCGMSRSAALLSNETNGGYLSYFADRLHFIMRAPPKTEELTTYKTEFTERWYVPSDTYTPAAFDAMMLIDLGLAESGGAGSDALRDAIVDVSRQGTEHRYTNLTAAVDDIGTGVDINYEGPSGPLDIRGCPAMPESGSCADTEKHFVPAAYYVELMREGDGSNGSYEVLQDWTDTPIIIE